MPSTRKTTSQRRRWSPAERAPTHWPVVVVGAGPAGLVAATALARAGVDCLIVDRHAAPSPLPRATVVSLRSMELLRSWGLETEVLAGGNDVEWRMLVAPTLADAGRGEVVDVGYPTKEQSLALSPTAPACVPQDHLEGVLVDGLRALPPARLRRRVALVALRTTADGFLLTMRSTESGATWSVLAQYVIGADGGRSTVRELAGIEQFATEPRARSLTTVFHAPLWDRLELHRYGIYAVTHPEAAGTFLPAGRDDRWVYGFQVGDAGGDEILPPAALVDRVRLAAGRPELDLRLGSSGIFDFVGAIADEFRRGDAFLIGDAAHRVTPRGGTGMNTAIADGFDLGWKLAWVLRGWAAPSLLDTYERERRSVAEHQLARSIDPDGSRRRAVDELPVDLGGRIRHVWLPSTAGRDRSTLDLVGPGLTVLHADGDRPVHPTTSLDPSAPVVVHRLDPLAARALGILPTNRLVVRPDGVPLAAPRSQAA